MRAQFLKIGCYDIDDFVENMVEGNEIEHNRHRFEKMDEICNHCNALKWKHETEGFCCQKGEVVLATLSPAPPNLHTFLTTNDSKNKPFVKQIRAYNGLFSFTSLSIKPIEELADETHGIYTFKIQGAMYHQISGLMPKEIGLKPGFSQIYFYDTDLDAQLQRRKEIIPDLDSNMIRMLQDELHMINPFV